MLLACTLFAHLFEHERDGHMVMIKIYDMKYSHVFYLITFQTGNRITPDAPGSNINGMLFSSLDRDNDRHSHGHCAQNQSGGWWFNVCHDAYLNGPYGSSSWKQPWYPLFSTGENIKETTMMIRKR